MAVEGHDDIDEQGFHRPPAAFETNDGVEDGRDNSLQPSSTPIIILPSQITNSHDQPVPTPALNSPNQQASDSDTYAPAITPPAQATVREAVAAGTQAQPSRRRRREAVARRGRVRRTLTPFERAAREFAAIEQRRLQLEERRLEIEGRRIEADNARTSVFNRLADIAEGMIQQYLQSRGHTE